MNIIYIHGLDSSAQSVKGLLLEQYCQNQDSAIQVTRPDVNAPPAQVFKQLCELVASSRDKHTHTALMGSSLGGYFASLVSNETGCPALLLNPSTQPHITLQRFIDDSEIQANQDTVIYQTLGGWQVTLKDLYWFTAHQLTAIEYPKRLFGLIKAGDELLDASIAANFLQSQQVEIALQQGGDHRMTDFGEQLPMVVEQVKQLVKAE